MITKLARPGGENDSGKCTTLRIPARSTIAQSVKVPPMSMPTR